MRLGPTCPDCAAPVPYRQTRWRFAKGFPCAHCDASLAVSRWHAAVWGGVAGAVFAGFRDYFPPDAGQFAFFALIVIVVLPLTWATTKVRRLADVG